MSGKQFKTSYKMLVALVDMKNHFFCLLSRRSNVFNFCNEAIIISTETHWRYNHSNLDCNLTNLYYNTKESYVILNAIIEKRFKAFTQTFTENCSLLILRISPYSVRMWENADRKKLCIWTLFTLCIVKCQPQSRLQFKPFQNSKQ